MEFFGELFRVHGLDDGQVRAFDDSLHLVGLAVADKVPFDVGTFLEYLGVVRLFD